ncbi:MAG: hypothetical protein IPK96_02980 [Flammeovirgaceae bacterium]|nr:hypothetical protein [Flammeovirgaceae bacterium]
MKKNLTFLLLLALVITGQAQQKDVPPIFKEEQPLALSLKFSFKEVKKEKVDSIYFPTHFGFKNEKGQNDSIAIKVRARGNFRRNNCFYPPIRVKLKKKSAEGTAFEDNKDFKLVLPCQTGKIGNDLILKEYLCYKILEPITPYFFHTRLVDLELTDLSGKPKTYSVKSFLIEDDDLIAHRFNGKVVEQDIHPLTLSDTTSVIFDFFQYLIGNTDWSAAQQHNVKIIQTANKKIPLTYDFDMAGLVNAPYATVSEALTISSVQERLYRGFCRNESLMQYARSEYLRLEPAIMKVIKDHQALYSERDFKGIEKFVGEFFETLKNDKRFKDAVLLGCRTK